MQHSYSAFGLKLVSNQALPGLLKGHAGSPDVRVHIGRIEREDAGSLVHLKRLPENEAGEALLTVRRSAAGRFHFEYRDKTNFVVDDSGSEVWAEWPPDLTLEDMTTYLFGPILGFVLRLRGSICLHASSIAIEDSAIALLGAAGAGKSTTAASFAKLGYRIIADDVSALMEQEASFYVPPGYPGLRLWPDSVKFLWGSPEALPRLTPTWNKRYLDLSEKGYGFATEPIRLLAIYILGKRTSDSVAAIEPSDSRASFMSLVANSYVNYLLDSDMRAKEFDVLGRLVATVPIRKVIPHSDPARLPELCGLIADDARALTAPLHA